MSNTVHLNTDKGPYSPIIPSDTEVKLLEIIGNGVSFKHRLINDRQRLEWVLGVFKKEGKTIVYTSGVYDMIHEGHLRYLEAAKKLGDILIVGVDSDELTRERKPDIKNRPIVPLQERLFVLSNIRSVDILTVRNVGEHPAQLIVNIKPDIAVFSRSTKDVGENAIQEELGPYCGKIIFLEPQAETSTTARIRAVMEDGANDLGRVVTKAINGYLNKKEGGEDVKT